MSKKIPTFISDGKVLLGAAAKEAWANQPAQRCACGCHGSASRTISGTCRDMPAEWLGCTNCPGTALGQPLVYRIPAQIAFARQELATA